MPAKVSGSLVFCSFIGWSQSLCFGGGGPRESSTPSCAIHIRFDGRMPDACYGRCRFRSASADRAGGRSDQPAHQTRRSPIRSATKGTSPSLSISPRQSGQKATSRQRRPAQRASPTPSRLPAATASMPGPISTAIPRTRSPTASGITTAAGDTGAGDRSGVSNALFVITDGSPNRPPSGGNLNDASTWLTGANAAIDAANTARSQGWVVKAIYVGEPDPSLPFSTSDRAVWVDADMKAIGGGSVTELSNFSSLVHGLLISVGCPTPPT